MFLFFFSLLAFQEFINRRNLTEFGNLALVEQRDQLEGGDIAIRLPGVQRGDMASRNFKPEVNVYCIRFSPTAQSWAAATTEGLLVYSLDRGIVFDPLNLSLEVTPKAARACIERHEYSTALIMALKLNEAKFTEEIMERIPNNDSEYNIFAVFAAQKSKFPINHAIVYVTRLRKRSIHTRCIVKWMNLFFDCITSIHEKKRNSLCVCGLLWLAV